MVVVRLLVGVAGIACIGRALRAAVGHPRAAAPRPRRLPALLDHLAALLEAAPALRRQADDATADRRLALAPGAWPWWLVDAGPGVANPAAIARFAALRVGTLAAGATVASLALIAAGTLALPVAAAAVVLGLTGPDLATTSAARDAERRLVTGLPDLLDCLASGLEAGLVLERAVTLAADAAEPPLEAVLRRVLAAIRLGEPPGSALLREAGRCGVPALGAAAATLERGRRLGEPVASALLAAATGARAEASSRAAARSARTSSLAALVVAMVIAPACVVAVLGVVIGGLLGAGQPPPGG